MNRREFLQHGVTMGARVVLSGMPQFARGARATEAPWRTFEVTTRLAVTEAVGSVRAWVPVPLLSQTAYFQWEPDRWTGNCTAAQAQSPCKVTLRTSVSGKELFEIHAGAYSQPAVRPRTRPSPAVPCLSGWSQRKR